MTAPAERLWAHERVAREKAEARVAELEGQRAADLAASIPHDQVAAQALRAEVLKTVARALLAEAEAYDAKWCHRPRDPDTSDWDKGYVAGMQRAAHDVANSIDRPVVLAEVRDETKGTSDA